MREKKIVKHGKKKSTFSVWAHRLSALRAQGMKSSRPEGLKNGVSGIRLWFCPVVRSVVRPVVHLLVRLVVRPVVRPFRSRAQQAPRLLVLYILNQSWSSVTCSASISTRLQAIHTKPGKSQPKSKTLF